MTCDLSEGLQYGPNNIREGYKLVFFFFYSSFFWGGGGQWLEAADLREVYGVRTCDPRRATGWGLPTLGKGMG